MFQCFTCHYIDFNSDYVSIISYCVVTFNVRLIVVSLISLFALLGSSSRNNGAETRESLALQNT